VISAYRGDGVSIEDADSIGERTLPKEKFDILRAEADQHLAKIAAGLERGDVPATPKQKAGSESVTACTYCNFKSICNYEA
jgi:ATP-dependent helicase/DNAse subunit B